MRKVTLLLAVLMILLISGFAQSAEDTEYELALEHYNNGNFNKTVEILEKYVRQNPKPEAYFLIAYSLYKLNQHEKANEYFNALFLIEPEYSPTPALIEAGKWPPEKMFEEAGVKLDKPVAKPMHVEPVVEEPSEAVPAPSAAPTPPVAKAPTPPAPPTPPVAKAPTPPVPPTPPVAKAPSPPVPPTPPVAKAPSPPAPPTPPVAKAPTPPAPPTPPVAKPAPKPPISSVLPFKQIPAMPPIPISPEIAIAIFAVMWIILCLPFFLIARKLSVPGAWTAFIPILQVWAILKSADKPIWWVLLMLVPLVNFFISIYIVMCITQNLGKNKWLGLLILVPVINILFPFYLAFSKYEDAHEGLAPEDFGLDQEPELDIGDTSFLDEEEPEQLPEEPVPAGEEPSFFEEEPEQHAEEPAPGWSEEEPEQPVEESEEPEAPAGWGDESEEEPLAWGETDEDEPK